MKNLQPYAWIILALLLAAQIVMSMGSFSFGPLAPFLRDDLGISRTRVGSLITIFYFFTTLSTIPAGILVDRMGARPMLILSLIIEGVPFALMPLADDFVMISLCAALSGIGYSFTNQVSTRGIINWFPPELRATAMGIKQSGVTIGAAATAWLLPVLATIYSWKTGMWTVGITMFGMAIIAFIAYRESPSVPFATLPETPERREGTSLLFLLAQPKLLALLLVAPLLAFSHGGTVSFLVLYLKEQILLPVELAGKCMTASMVAATMGRVCWGIVSDRIFSGDRLQPLIIMSTTGAVSTLGMALLTAGGALWPSFFWSVLLGFSLSGWNAIIMVLSAELGGIKRAASVVSVMMTVVGLGFLAGPIVFGYVADLAGYFSSWLLIVITCLASLAGFVRISHQQSREKQ